MAYIQNGKKLKGVQTVSVDRNIGVATINFDNESDSFLMCAGTGEYPPYIFAASSKTFNITFPWGTYTPLGDVTIEGVKYYYYSVTAFPTPSDIYFVNDDETVLTRPNYYDIISYMLEHFVTDEPTFDLDVYTQGTTNPLISLVWSNLQNAEEGVSYYIAVGVNKNQPPLPYEFVNWIDGATFESGSISISFKDAQEIGTALPVGQNELRVLFGVSLFHYDDRGIRIIDDEKMVNVGNGGSITGDDIEKHEQSSVATDDNYNEETNTYINPHGGTEETLDNLLTTSYVLTKTELLALKNFLWSADYHDNVYLLNNSPIENIISIKTIPFSVASANSVTLKIGNVVATGVTGKTTETTHKYTLPVVSVPKKYNNFLDYYKTSVSVYLPFIGVHDLPTNIVMGKNLRFTYLYDIVTGACAVEIAVGTGSTYSPIDYVMGNCGIDLPISAQNRTQVEIAQQKIRNSGVANAIGGVASTIGNLISGNIGGAISSGATTTANAMNNYLDYSTQEYHTTTKGVIGSQLINFIPNECYLIIDRPIYTKPSTYAHDFGFPCELSLTLGNLTGFTQVSHSIELSGIPCTEQERTELKNLLIGGVYL
ncbi:MAG: hypothetical protein Q4A15_01035 [Prevotellaceae bacterium]|nr:hypothetical protein [Prevotellaceae bacterium]